VRLADGRCARFAFRIIQTGLLETVQKSRWVADIERSYVVGVPNLHRQAGIFAQRFPYRASSNLGSVIQNKTLHLHSYFPSD
jgi:hypothetical protein